MSKYLINSVDIGGFRSYRQTPNKTTLYKRINLFIGPNNSGKSNVLRFFETVIDHLNDSSKYISKSDLYLRHEKDSISGTISIGEGEFVISAHENKLNITNSQGNLHIDNDLFFKKCLHFIDAKREKIELHSLLKKVKEEKEGIDFNDYIEKISTWLREILEEPINVKWAAVGNQLEFEFFPLNGQLIQELNDLGSGVEQVVKILTYLYVETKTLKKEGISGVNFFIEEPETNLHNKAVISLVKILNQDELLKNNRYFITTHSNAFIDQADDNWTISQVKLSGERNTELSLSSRKLDLVEILDSIGVKPSQLLQTNVVLWVEGPSDRLYLKKWIDLCNTKFIEGKHYSFIMYGGSLLDHISAEVNNEDPLDEFIDVLSTSPYAVIIIDRDRKSNDNNFKKRVNKLGRRITDNRVGHKVKLHMTWGREIENFIPKRILVPVLSGLEKKNVSYKENDIQKKINFKSFLKPDKKKYYFTKNDSFDESYAKWLLTDEIMNKFNLKKGSEPYNSIVEKLSRVSKIVVAKKVADLFEKEDLNKNLINWLSEIILVIDNANSSKN